MGFLGLAFLLFLAAFRLGVLPGQGRTVGLGDGPGAEASRARGSASAGARHSGSPEDRGHPSGTDSQAALPASSGPIGARSPIQGGSPLFPKGLRKGAESPLADGKKEPPALLEETREVLVFLKPGTPAQPFAQELGADLKRTLIGLPDIHVLRTGTPEAARDLRSRASVDPRVERVYMNVRTQHVHCAWVPNDPYFPDGSPSASFHGQWHLGNGASTTHANVVAAWSRDVTGQGVLIGIVDDCLEKAHPDLSPNFVLADSWNFAVGGTSDPSPDPAYDGTANEDMHGTSVSGVAAAAGGNGTGVTGAAPKANLAGLRIDFPGQTTDMFVNATLYHSSPASGTNIKIKNHSYGFSATYVDNAAEDQAVTTSASVGTIHLYAAGNERGSVGQDSNKEQPQNNPDAIAVAAIGSDGKFSFYSSFGANVLVCSPSNGISGFGITTTDRMGNHGYNASGAVTASGATDTDAFPDTSYTSQFGGTSSATPLVTGIMALGKQVQPNLDVRFAKHALIRSATIVDSNDNSVTGGGDGATPGSAWQQNTALIKFNQNYGFGLVNADGFIQQVLTHSGVTPLQTESTGTQTVGVTIPDNNLVGVSRTFSLASTTPLEEIQVTLNLTHSRRGDLEAYLTSPTGTTRRLFYRSSTDTGALPDPGWSFPAWTFVTHEFWGENPSGTWTLMVRDVRSSKIGTWNSYAVTARMGTLIADTTPPSVISITRSAASPTNAASVPFTVTFSEPVTGVGVGSFSLTTGGTIAGASITSVTGSLSTYTVTVNTGSGDGTLRLDLVSGAVINDTAGNLISGGGFTSGEVYDIRKTPPAVTSLGSTAANGAYTAGAIIPVTVTFSENVTVTGTPQLTLATGGPGTTVNYSSGSGLATLTFLYTVGAGQNSPDLDCISSAALVANGGTIKDAAGNAALLTLPAPGSAGSLGANQAIVIDTTAPGSSGTPAASANPNQGSFTVSWTAASDGSGTGIASYTLQRSADGGATWTPVSSGSAATSFAEVALAQGTYVYRVRAVDGAGNLGPWSAMSASILDDQTPPSVPGTPTVAANPNVGTFTVQWTASTDGGAGLSSYTLQRSADGGATWTPISTGSAATSFAQSSLGQGSYLYRVQALDGVGNTSGWSGTSVAIIVDLTPPSVPGTPTVSANPNGGAFTVLWSGSSDTGGSSLASYTLFRSANGGASWTPVSSGSPLTSFAESGLAQGSYLYRVVAVDGAGNASAPSSNSAAIVVDTTPPGTPGTPVTSSANPTNAGSFVLTWTATSDSGGSASFSYSLERSGDGGSTWGTVAAGLGTPAFTDSGLGQGSYLYRSRAVDQAGNAGSASPASVSMIVDKTAPSVPGTPTIAANPNTGSFTVVWTASTDTGGAALASYTLSRSANGGGSWTVISSGSLATSFGEVALGQGSYLYRVQAVDGVGNTSAASASSATVVVDTSAPTSPGIPVASATPNTGTFTVSWTAASDTGGSGLASYTVQRSLNGGAFVTIASGGTALTLGQTALAQGSYTYRVLAVDGVGNTSAASGVSAAVVVDTTAPSAPGTPVGSPSPNSTGTFTVSWTASTDTGGSGLASYTVQRALNGGAFATVASGGTALTLGQTALAQGSYTYQVLAVDGAGNTSAASGVSAAVVVDTTSPSTPGTPVGSLSPNAGTFTVSWAASTDTGGSGLASYTVQRSLNGGAFATVASGGTALTLGQTALPQGSYTYQVLALDGAGNTSAASGVSAAVVVDTTAPSAPGTPVGSPSPNSTGSFTVSWTAASDGGGSGVASYTVQRSLNGGAFATIASGGSGLTLGQTALAQGSYTYQVLAVDGAGNTSAASGISAPVVVDTTAPSTPGTPVGSLSPNAGTFTVSWTASADTGGSGLASYTVQRALNGGAFATVASGGAALTLNQTALPQGSYTYQVLAVDGAGNTSAASGVSAAVVVDTTAPSAPGTPVGAPNPNNTGTFTVSWTAASDSGGSGVASYTVQRALNGGAFATVASGGTALTLNQTALAQGSYTYQVLAVDGAGNTSAASGVSAAVVVDTTAPSVPGTPVGSPNPNNTGTFTVSWTASTDTGGSGLASYTVQRSLNGGAFATVASGGTALTLNQTSLPQGSYTYQVLALDGAGNTSPASGVSPPVLVDSTAPSAPGTPVGSPSPNSTGTFTVSWTASIDTGGSGLASYTVQRSLNGGAFATVASGGTALTLNQTALAQGSYTYQVLAVDGAGNTSAASGVSAAVVVDTTAPSAPGTPVGAPSPNKGTFTVSWTAASDGGGSGLASYTVQRSLNGGAFATVASGGTALTLNQTSLPQGSYTYQVLAWSGAGNAGTECRSWGAAEVYTTDPSTPGTPVGSLSPNAGTFTVSWAASTDTGGSGLASYTVQRALNGGAFATVASGGAALTLNQTALPQGSYTYQVLAVDGAGNTSAASGVSAAVVVDTTAPSVPGTPIGSSSPNKGTFTVSWTASTDTGGSGLASYTVQRALNGGAFATVASGGLALTLNQTALAQGSYTYQVLAVDGAGNTSAASGVSAAVVVDTTAPLAPGTPVGAPNPNNTGTFTVSWTAATDSGGSGVASYTVQRSLNGGAFVTIASGGATLTLNQTALVQGSYQYQVQAVDGAGNAGVFSSPSAPVIVDTTAPSAPGIPAGSPSPTNGDFTLNWTAATDTGGSGVSSYTVQRSFNGGGFVQVASGAAGTSLAQTGLAQGAYRFKVQAVDGAGNIGPLSSASPAVIVITTAPVTTILAKPPNPSSSAGATFLFSANVSGATFQTKLDGAAVWTSNGTANFASYTGLSNGSHTFQVRAVDAAGNVDPAPPSYTWTVNTSGGVTQTPDTILTSSPSNPTTQTTATFTFLSTEAGGTFDVKLDGGGWTSNGASGTKTYTGLSTGAHNFQVRAVDAALNVDPTPASFSWTIVAPPVDQTAPLLNSFSNAVALTHWTISSTDAQVTWAVDGTPAAMPGNPYFSAPSSLNYNNGTDYDSPGFPNSGTATSPPITISGLSGARLKFFCNYQTETAGIDQDVRYVQISNDNFATLLVNEQLSTSPGSAVAGDCAAMGTWHEHIIALGGLTGPIQVRFLFDTLDAGLNNFPGWFIDDFEISDLFVSGISALVTGSSVPLPVGGTSSSDSVTLGGVISQDAVGSVTLEVEIKPVGTAFTGTPTASASASGPGTALSVPLTFPGNGAYHWQVRTVTGGVTSSWMSLGLNAESDPDIVILVAGTGSSGGGGGCGLTGFESLLVLAFVVVARRRRLPRMASRGPLTCSASER